MPSEEERIKIQKEKRKGYIVSDRDEEYKTIKIS